MKRQSRKQKLENIKGTWAIAEIKISYKPIFTDQKTITSIQEAYELIRSL